MARAPGQGTHTGHTSCSEHSRALKPKNQSHTGKVGASRGVFLLTPLPASLVTGVSFTFQDLVDSDVSHELLHRVILQVAVAPVHLQSLVTYLRGQHCCEVACGGHKELGKDPGTWAHFFS